MGYLIQLDMQREGIEVKCEWQRDYISISSRFCRKFSNLDSSGIIANSSGKMVIDSLPERGDLCSVNERR